MVSLVRRDNRKDSHVKTLRSFLLSHRHPPSWFKSRLSNPNRMRLDFGAQASGTHPSPVSHHNQPRETRSKARRKATVGYLVDRRIEYEHNNIIKTRKFGRLIAKFRLRLGGSPNCKIQNTDRALSR